MDDADAEETHGGVNPPFSSPAPKCGVEHHLVRGRLVLVQQANDQEIIKILRKMKKQRQESADLYKKGGRQELLSVEEAEIKVIDTFLPKQLSEEETKKICKETIQSVGASSIKDMGKIMSSLKQKYSDSIDFSKVNVIVKGLLNQ